MILYNQKRFDAEGFFHEAAISESRIEYIPVSREIRQLHRYKITQTHLELQDHDLIEINKMTLITREDLFTLN